MKAVVFEKYGPPEVLELQELAKPIPKDNEALIKVYATTVTSAETLARRGGSMVGKLIIGLRSPRERFRILGMELAGEIESIGKDFKRFSVGDQVYGFTGFRLGAYAEFVCMPEKGSLALKPDNLTNEEAAASVDGASTALYFLRDRGKLQPGQKVLIIGASGCIGTFAVQLARYFGAEVTGVCSGPNAEWVKALGATKVFDYTKEDFSKSGETFDIIFDTLGKSSFLRCRNSLKTNGRYIVTNGNMLWNYFLTFWTSIAGSKKFVYGLSIEKNESLNFVRELIEAGKIKPVIDRCYPMEHIVEAHRYVETGRKKGNVVITVGA